MNNHTIDARKSYQQLECLFNIRIDQQYKTVLSYEANQNAYVFSFTYTDKKDLVNSLIEMGDEL